MWPLDIVKKRKQALLKHRRILYYSLGGCVVVAGVTGTVLGILLTKSKQNDDPPPSPLPPIVATKFTDLNVGDDLANKFLLMPQSGWNWDSNVELSHKWDATLKIITFNSPPKRIKSPMYSIYYRIKNESNVLFPYESLCFGDDFDDIVSDSEKLCKLPFSSCVMSWNEDYDNLKEKTYSYNGNEYYYFKLLASFELKITSLNFKDIETDTSANFGNFIKNCYIADQINN